MKFEVLNRFDQTMMQCQDYKYIPDKDVLESMYANEYKFRLDGKIISLKKAKELLKSQEAK